VVGLGVGYALACCLAKAGYDAIDVDINPDVVAGPRIDISVRNLLHYDHQHRNNIGEYLELSADYAKLSNCHYVTICVSTGNEKKLVLGYVEKAVDSC